MIRTRSVLRRPARRVAPRRRSSGFTLVETLVAIAILGLILVGVLPLFTQSMLNNLKGNRGTQAANNTGQVLEDAGHDRFLSPDLSWNTATSSLTYPIQYVAEDVTATIETAPQWVAAIPPGQSEAWRREVIVTQHGINDITDNNLLDTPLAGTWDPSGVQLKQVEVRVRAGGAFASPFTVRRVKSF
jgi:prepilin-type N-terminal cleavage/methylation domain-containing protein